MIKDFETKYLNLFYKQKFYQWCNYFENQNYDLNEIDKEIFDLISFYKNKIEGNYRRTNVARLIIAKDFVDKNPQVSLLRNKLDNFNNYNYNLDKKIINDKKEYNNILATRMKDDVLNLFNLRTFLAKEKGYNSYPDLIYNVEEVDKHIIFNVLNEYLNNNIYKVYQLIKKYDIKWDTWFNDLKKIEVGNINYDAVKLVNNLLEILGFNGLKEHLKIIYKETNIAGYATELVGNDIRIVVSPIKSIFDLNLLFHELGHAINYHYNMQHGVYRILPPSYDEAMAVVIEHLAIKLLFNSDIQEKMEEVETLEYTRSAISALFEFDLWESLDEAEELYLKHYSKLGLNINQPGWWVLDSFRSIDAVYIHNYVIGAYLGDSIYKYLNYKYSKEYNLYGKWLVDNIYKSGRKKSFLDKVEIFLKCNQN